MTSATAPDVSLNASLAMPSLEAVLAPLERDAGLSARIYHQLRQALMRGKLRPGQRLVHRTLAAEFRVSPTPVREAVMLLAAEAALMLDQRGVAMVPELKPETYAEILSLRLELEGRAAAAAAAKPNAKLAKEFRSIHDRLTAARRSGDEETHLAANEDFHFLILSAANMPVLARLVETLWMRCGPVLRYNIPYEGPIREHPHLGFITAVAQGSSEQARAAMIGDIERGGQIILGKLAERSRQRAESPRLPFSVN